MELEREIENLKEKQFATDLNLERLRGEMNAGFAEVNGRVDSMAAKMEGRISTLSVKMTVMTTLLVGVAVAILAQRFWP